MMAKEAKQAELLTFIKDLKFISPVKHSELAGLAAVQPDPHAWLRKFARANNPTKSRMLDEARALIAAQLDPPEPPPESMGLDVPDGDDGDCPDFRADGSAGENENGTVPLDPDSSEAEAEAEAEKPPAPAKARQGSQIRPACPIHGVLCESKGTHHGVTYYVCPEDGCIYREKVAVPHLMRLLKNRRRRGPAEDFNAR